MTEKEFIHWLESTKESRAKWREETVRLNEGLVPKVGDRVSDAYGRVGVVSEISAWDEDGEPLSIENHGMVTDRGSRLQL